MSQFHILLLISISWNFSPVYRFLCVFYVIIWVCMRAPPLTVQALLPLCSRAGISIHKLFNLNVTLSCLSTLYMFSCDERQVLNEEREWVSERAPARKHYEREKVLLRGKRAQDKSIVCMMYMMNWPNEFCF